MLSLCFGVPAIIIFRFVSPPQSLGRSVGRHGFPGKPALLRFPDFSGRREEEGGRGRRDVRSAHPALALALSAAARRGVNDW